MTGVIKDSMRKWSWHVRVKSLMKWQRVVNDRWRIFVWIFFLCLPWIGSFRGVLVVSGARMWRWFTSDGVWAPRGRKNGELEGWRRAVEGGGGRGWTGRREKKSKTNPSNKTINIHEKQNRNRYEIRRETWKGGGKEPVRLAPHRNRQLTVV